MKKLVILTALLALLVSSSTVFAASYSTDQNARHIEICIDLTKAWYTAFNAGDSPKTDSVHKTLIKYNNYLVSDNDAITVIQQAKVK